MKIEIKIKRWRVLPDYKNGDALEKLCLEKNYILQGDNKSCVKKKINK